MFAVAAGLSMCVRARSAEEIARVWSEAIFGDVYTAVKNRP
jgi:hypothetical protein